MTFNLISLLLPIFCECFQLGVGPLMSLQEMVDMFPNQIRALEAVKKAVLAKVVNPTKERNSVASAWLESVDMLLKSSPALASKFQEMSSSWNLFRCACWWNYKLAKEARKFLNQATALKEEGMDLLFYEQLQVVPFQFRNIGPTPIYCDVVGQERELDTALELIREDDSVGLIGIWGMGGLGKTILLKRINNYFWEKGRDTFDVVIFVTAGIEMSISNLLQDIAKKLGFQYGDEEDKRRQIFGYFQNKSFLLLIDDVWEKIELEHLGVPPFLHGKEEKGEQEIGGGRAYQRRRMKIVMTSRNRELLDSYKRNRIVEMGLLSKDESWELFSIMVGGTEFLRDEEIITAARNMAEECGNLPLTLAAVGRSMAGARELCEWRAALRELQHSKHQHEIMKNEVLPILRFSFNRLQDEMRHILFISMFYPSNMGFKDFNLARVVAFDTILPDMEQSFGYDVFGAEAAQDYAKCMILKLIRCGMFRTFVQDGCTVVKLHDCVHNMLIWLMETERDKYGNMILQWSSATRLADFLQRWGCARRVSMSGCDIREIPEEVVIPECTHLTSLLWSFCKLVRLPDNFFSSMTSLRVVDLSHSSLEEVPSSIGLLTHVTFLSLNGTNVRSLPPEMGKLQQLICLNLMSTVQLRIIPWECFSNPHKLEVLLILNSAFQWIWGSSRTGTEQITLQNLKELTEGGGPLRKLSLSLQADAAILKGLQVSRELRDSIAELEIDFRNFAGGIHMELKLIEVISGMKNLKALFLLHVGNTAEEKKEKVTVDVACFFPSLVELEIVGCSCRFDLAWIKHIPRLKKFAVSHCENLTTLFPVPTEGSSRICFPYLQILLIEQCPRLNSVTGCTLEHPSLKVLLVKGCPELRSFPFDEDSASTITRIEGSQEWWDSLNWENEGTKSKLLSRFVATT